MVLRFGLDMVFTNIRVSFEWTVVLVLLLASFVIAGRQFQIAMIVLFSTMAGVFIWFYETGLNWTLPLIVMIMALVVLALSLYTTNATSQTGGFT